MRAHHLARIGKSLTAMFLFLSFLYVVGYRLFPFLEGLWSVYSKMILVVFPLACVFMVVCFENSGIPAPPVSRKYVFVFLTAIALFTCIGAMNGNPARVIFIDMLVYVVILCGFILGRRDEMWDGLRFPVMIISIFALGIGFAFTGIEIVYDHSLLSESFGYEMSSQFAFLPLMVLVSAAQGRKSYFTSSQFALAATVFLFLVFAKRAPVTRLAIFLAVSFMLGIFSGRRNYRRMVLTMAGLILGCVVLSQLFPMADILQKLSSRFAGDYGFVESVTAENPRFFEVSAMMDELDWHEIIIGRGMGGYLTGPALMHFSQDVISQDIEGRLYVHVGNAVPLLKGGVFLATLYFLPAVLVILLVLMRGHSKWDISAACGTWALVYLLFQFIEGPPTYSNIGDALALGLVGGRIQSLHVEWPVQT